MAAFVLWPAAWRWLFGALLLNHVLLGGFGMWPRCRLLGDNLSRLPPARRRDDCVVLTFDDGPDPVATPRVLELLDQYNAKASFFCIGERAAAFPHIVEEIVRKGHSVENHSSRHSLIFACFPPGGLRRDIGHAQAILTRIAGAAPRFFRAPFGFRSPFLAPVLASTSLRYVSWTRRGFDRSSRCPEAVLRRLTRGLCAGDILLLHDTAAPRTGRGVPVVLAVLPALLQRIEAAGLRVLSLPLALPEHSMSQLAP